MSHTMRPSSLCLHSDLEQMSTYEGNFGVAAAAPGKELVASPHVVAQLDAQDEMEMQRVSRHTCAPQARCQHNSSPGQGAPILGGGRGDEHTYAAARSGAQDETEMPQVSQHMASRAMIDEQFRVLLKGSGKMGMRSDYAAAFGG